MDSRDRKFLESGQGALKLKIAIERYFSRDQLEDEVKTRYEEYLKNRIRPMMEALIEEEDMEALAKVEELGWLDNKVLDLFISMASAKEKIRALTFLLHVKEKNFLFEDEEFPL
jgi:hypothetical protein